MTVKSDVAQGFRNTYQLLHHSNQRNFYLKVYDEAYQASSNHKLKAKRTICSKDGLLGLDDRSTIHVDKERINLAFEPKFVHLGNSNLLRSPFSISKAKKYAFKIKYEVVRTKVFVDVISHGLTEFVFGSIKLPGGLQKAYSKFGTSYTDVSIRHKKLYKSNNQVAGGVIFPFVDTRIVVVDKNNKNDDGLIKGISNEGGVIEFKSERYDVDQMVREMLRYCGDLVAKVVIEGEKADNATMYGLAA